MPCVVLSRLYQVMKEVCHVFSLCCCWCENANVTANKNTSGVGWTLWTFQRKEKMKIFSTNSLKIRVLLVPRPVKKEEWKGAPAIAALTGEGVSRAFSSLGGEFVIHLFSFFKWTNGKNKQVTASRSIIFPSLSKQMLAQLKKEGKVCASYKGHVFILADT